MLAYVAVTAAVTLSAGAPFSFWLYATLWPIFAFVCLTLWLLGPRLPKAWRASERAVLAAPVMAAVPVFFSAFTSIKTAIITLHPYDWDARLIAADRAVFGVDAWRWLQPVLGHAPITFALSLLYTAWHGVLILSFGAILFALGHRELRRQAMLAFTLCWVLLGTAGAIFFSSVGPCFVGLLHLGPDSFAPQRAYMAAANQSLPILEFVEQERLLGAASSTTPVIGSGISAMPSMHVAITALLVLMGWRFSRWAGIAASAYFVIVVVASLHLGWHYATDDAFAAVGAVVIWFASGWVTRLSPKKV